MIGIFCSVWRKPTVAEGVGRGSLTGGRWGPRPGACPNVRGGITIERDLPAKTKPWLTGWTKPAHKQSLEVRIGNQACGVSYFK